ncbi:hypothetical protein [Lactococcus petauri]|uniref:hypothetical protein n=1 Tax=Lactococcus petauri TaxID=1940789 RepID=UPI001F5A0939|nr:hypothetical protein [Lactococcus petauri]
MKTKMLREKNAARCNVQLTGIVDIKKHRASSHCHFYDVTLYHRLNSHPRTGKLYPKKTLKEVKQLLSQGNFKPNVLSERLFDKILGE